MAIVFIYQNGGNYYEQNELIYIIRSLNEIILNRSVVFRLQLWS